MELSLDAVRAIADLAKLELSDAEIEMYASQLSHILQYFESLQKLDTSNIPPTASVLPLDSVLRPDDAKPALTPHLATLNAPDQEDDQFRVSAVLPE
jgi:aspartyl-tRNA(Asn)/glutamyl-tRNA(Gln) amidotransferase subunit C